MTQLDQRRGSSVAFGGAAQGGAPLGGERPDLIRKEEMAGGRVSFLWDAGMLPPGDDQAPWG
ncbi:hypothetical protein GCM10009601_50770 [Streptomyces thermospinosisporus]|uniref:Uncharacterized protein n=1 Tax=Streptomyces thermospinosisporus TaxID=161482 RepID=A0ABP4JVB7_9ACTN